MPATNAAISSFTSPGLEKPNSETSTWEPTALNAITGMAALTIPRTSRRAGRPGNSSGSNVPSWNPVDSRLVEDAAQRPGAGHKGELEQEQRLGSR